MSTRDNKTTKPSRRLVAILTQLSLVLTEKSASQDDEKKRKRMEQSMFRSPYIRQPCEEAGNQIFV